MSYKKHKTGFTLSEVLLVLSVIGVVAALTIPTLIQKVSNDQYVSKLKKEYSTLSQAFLLVQTDYNGDITPLFPGSATNVMNAFTTKLNVIKNCGTATGCWYNTPINGLNGTPTWPTPDTSFSGGKVILADGSLLFISNWSGTTCTGTYGTGPLANSVCGYIYLDLNGPSGPNIIGRDFFEFWITQSGIIPRGAFGDSVNCTGLGEGCSAKVLQESTISY